jgi:hypothetical protein
VRHTGAALHGQRPTEIGGHVASHDQGLRPLQTGARRLGPLWRAWSYQMGTRSCGLEQ